MKSRIRKISIGIGIVIVSFVGVFCLGRYGWKLFGFALCEGAGIELVEVKENQVHVMGF